MRDTKRPKGREAVRITGGEKMSDAVTITGMICLTVMFITIVGVIKRR